MDLHTCFLRSGSYGSYSMGSSPDTIFPKRWQLDTYSFAAITLELFLWKEDIYVLTYGRIHIDAAVPVCDSQNLLLSLELLIERLQY